MLSLSLHSVKVFWIVVLSDCFAERIVLAVTSWFNMVAMRLRNLSKSEGAITKMLTDQARKRTLSVLSFLRLL
jgi:hypothetical protein